MSRKKGATTLTNFRLKNELLDAIESQVGQPGAPKDRTAYITKLIENDLKIAADEKLFLEPDVEKIVDEVRLKNRPPSSRSLIVNWAVREFLSNLD